VLSKFGGRSISTVIIFPIGNRLFNYVLATVIGGAIGNIIDQVAPGFVIDFFPHRYGFRASSMWPTALLPIGVIMLALYLLVKGEERPRRVPADDALLATF